MAGVASEHKVNNGRSSITAGVFAAGRGLKCMAIA